MLEPHAMHHRHVAFKFAMLEKAKQQKESSN
jgi:hypothetical protein